jgi:hypothetical protein
MGAGGRSVTTDCHDAFSASARAFSTPHFWTATTLMGRLDRLEVDVLRREACVSLSLQSL